MFVVEGFSMKMKDQNLSDNAKWNIATTEQMLNKRHAKKFYSALQVTSKNEDDNTVAPAFDLWQHTPASHSSTRGLLLEAIVNIFCIHNLKADIADLYLYHEGQARKSPNKVCTFCGNIFEFYQVL